uniref:hypothetical protein n=1 Tax=Neokomagataea tanensis TaxID=661191 RepID=UPI002265933A
VARQAHNLKAVGSNPTPATIFIKLSLTLTAQSLGSHADFWVCAACNNATSFALKLNAMRA